HGEYRVLVAGGGEEALRLINASAPDLVLLDLNMPGMDGFEVLREIRRTEKFSSLPVLFVTGESDAYS
ncbi:MAG: response regulator, partial [Clostridiales bacterium]|nr:response regulator [Clostridiales bacterium]